MQELQEHNWFAYSTSRWVLIEVVTQAKAERSPESQSASINRITLRAYSVIKYCKRQETPSVHIVKATIYLRHIYRNIGTEREEANTHLISHHRGKKETSPKTK